MKDKQLDGVATTTVFLLKLTAIGSSQLSLRLVSLILSEIWGRISILKDMGRKRILPGQDEEERTQGHSVEI